MKNALGYYQELIVAIASILFLLWSARGLTLLLNGSGTEILLLITFELIAVPIFAIMLDKILDKYTRED